MVFAGQHRRLEELAQAVIQMKDRLGSGLLLGDPTPAGADRTGLAVALETASNEIDIGVIGAGRPVFLKVVEEGVSRYRLGICLFF